MAVLTSIATRVRPQRAAAVSRWSAAAQQATHEALGECDLRWLVAASLLCAALLRAAAHH